MAVAAQSRPKPGGGRLFIIVGVILAIGAFGMVFLIGSTGAHGGASGATTQYVVASRDIQIREQITKDDIVLAPFNQDPTAGKGYTKLEDVAKSGLIAEVSIAKGQPLSTNILAKSGDVVSGAQPAYLPIPQGFVAITIPTNEQQGVAGYVQAGDYINIIATVSSGAFQNNAGTSKTVSKTVYTNLHVLRLGPSTGTVQSASGSSQGAAQTGGVASSMTVVMTECDAEYLNWLQGAAQMKYTLGSYKDYQPQDTKVDSTCANASAAKGVGPAQVNARWGFTNT